MIFQCDKNVGTAFISRENYEKLANEHLNNNETYRIIENDPLEDISYNINTTILDLIEKKDINKRLGNNLIEKNPKLGTLNIQVKLHKQKRGIRPIINSIRHPTSRISLFLYCILIFFVQSMSSYLKDSQSLIQKGQNIFIPKNACLITADLNHFIQI